MISSLRSRRRLHHHRRRGVVVVFAGAVVVVAFVNLVQEVKGADLEVVEALYFDLGLF